MSIERRVLGIRRLSDDALQASLRRVLGSNRKLVALILAHLGEVEARRLHLLAGSESMFAYCTRRLGMSEDEACRRIDVARLARRFPALLDPLARGHLSLSVAALLKHHLTDQNDAALIAAVSGKTVARAREVLATWFPRPDVPATIRKLPERRARVSAASEPGAPAPDGALFASIVAAQSDVMPGFPPAPACAASCPTPAGTDPMTGRSGAPMADCRPPPDGTSGRTVLERFSPDVASVPTSLDPVTAGHGATRRMALQRTTSEHAVADQPAEHVTAGDAATEQGPPRRVAAQPAPSVAAERAGAEPVGPVHGASESVGDGAPELVAAEGATSAHVAAERAVAEPVGPVHGASESVEHGAPELVAAEGATSAHVAAERVGAEPVGPVHGASESVGDGAPERSGEGATSAHVAAERAGAEQVAPACAASERVDGATHGGATDCVAGLAAASCRGVAGRATHGRVAGAGSDGSYASPGGARTNHPSTCIEPLSAARYRVQFTADGELKQKLDLARDLLRHAVPNGDLPTIIGRALDLLLDKTLQRRFAKSNPRKGARATAPSNAASRREMTTMASLSRDEEARETSTSTTSAMGSTAVATSATRADSTMPASHGAGPSGLEHAGPLRAPEVAVASAKAASIASQSPSRYLPSDVRRAVLERDGLRCTWVGPDGSRCESRAWLEHDHIIPRGLGGSDDPENVRIRCRAHNQLAAEQAYGEATIARIITARRASSRTNADATPNAGRPAPT